MGDGSEYKKYGTMQSGDPGSDISTAPVTLSSTGVLTPKTTISYEDGIQTIRVNVQITDGKSSAISKEFHFDVEDSLDDGTLVVRGKLLNGSHTIAKATVWQDLDNDGVLDRENPILPQIGMVILTLV